MSHPLVWLVWRDTARATRALGARLRRPRGAMAAAGLALFCAIALASGGRTPGVQAGVETYGAPGLMALVLLGAFSPLGLYFRPAEVQWLLAAPLPRWQLVLYNVAVRSRAAVFSGALLSALPAWRGGSWAGSFAGYTLVFLLLQISAQWFAVVRTWLALRLPRAARIALGAALPGVPALALLLELRAGPELPLPELAASSSVLAAFGAPARPFLALLVAPDARGALAAGAAASAILAAFVAHVCWLRIPYRETAALQSERRARHFARLRSGGAPSAGGARRRLPMPPRLGGAGPVAWRQLQELVRNPRGLWLVSTIVGLVLAACIGLPWLRDDPELGVRLGQTGIFLVVMLPLLMGDNLACDFRRDLERMAQLKSWPVPPLALAAGQIAPAAVFAVTLQALGVAVLALATSAVAPAVAWLVLGLLPIVSWVALCIDNLFFLWVPYRTVPDDPGDVAFVGRTFATAMFKFMSLIAVLGATLALGWLALALTRSPVAALGVPLASLLLACVVGTWAVARAFARFDVSRDASV